VGWWGNVSSVDYVSWGGMEAVERGMGSNDSWVGWGSMADPCVGHGIVRGI
jgi:hypothetical protein